MDKATPLFEASKNATIITNDNKSKQKQSCTTPRPQSKIEDSRKTNFLICHASEKFCKDFCFVYQTPRLILLFLLGETIQKPRIVCI